MNTQDEKSRLQRKEIEKELAKALADRSKATSLLAELSVLQTESSQRILTTEITSHHERELVKRRIAELRATNDALETTLKNQGSEDYAQRRIQPSGSFLEDLGMDIQYVKDELRRQDNLLGEMNRFRPYCKYLPFDILRLIFQALNPRHDFLQHLLTSGPHSPWSQSIRTKKTLIMVSRSWREVALPFLYEVVSLRRVGQLVALARTLRQNAREYSHLIRRLSLSFYIPEGYRQNVERNMADILARCIYITELSFESAFTDWFPSIEPSLSSSIAKENALVAALKEAGPRINKFAYVDTESSSLNGRSLIPMQLINQFTNLVSLSLLLPPSTLTGDHSSDLDAQSQLEIPSLTLKALEDLVLLHQEADIYLNAMAKSWEMPKLKYLSFRSFSSVKREIRPDWDLYHQFFTKFGDGLRYLDFGPHEPYRSYKEAKEEIDELVEMCPNLEHLVISSDYIDGPFESPCDGETSCHIDIWVSLSTQVLKTYYLDMDYTDDKSFLSPFFSASNDGTFLSGIRFIDRGLTHIPDVPRLLFPLPSEGEDEPQTHAPLIHRMPGFSIIQTDWCLFRQNADWNKPWDGLPETLQDFMEPYSIQCPNALCRNGRCAHSSCSECWSDKTDEHLRQNGGFGSSTDNSSRSACRWVLRENPSHYSDSSWVDSQEVDDDHETPNLGWSTGNGGQDEKESPVLDEQLRLTEEDVLDIFSTQLGSNMIPDQVWYGGWL
ncbi:hypothetical protein NLI96_g537 [Meripilus lineatus]|uniref:Uncharacterized protein n=1 Tax=Meripilus lineatus TaxID=2056292 RepID=A0AAD5VC59_9APHY|nr:hypothetical protein NLI96_g537 [Physisporinus lineatus]